MGPQFGRIIFFGESLASLRVLKMRACLAIERIAHEEMGSLKLYVDLGSDSTTDLTVRNRLIAHS
jgi:hypothetical protein